MMRTVAEVRGAQGSAADRHIGFLPTKQCVRWVGSLMENRSSRSSDRFPRWPGQMPNPGEATAVLVDAGTAVPRFSVQR